MSINDTQTQVHIPTLIAISVVAWALVNTMHEVVGHAGAAIAVGVPVKAVSTSTACMNVDWPESAAERGLNPMRFITAAGTMVNLVTGALALLALQWKKVTSTAMRYFLWLFGTFSMIIIAMNMVTNPLLGFEDWTEFLSTIDQKNIWKTLIIGVGLVLVVAGYVLSLRLWMPQMRGHRPTLLGITAIPVVTMITVQTLSLVKSPFATLPPQTNHLLASVFAYIHFVLWAMVVNLIPGPRSSDTLDAIRLRRSNAWLALGLVPFVFFVLVLGPGIGSFAGDPRLG